MHAMRVIAQVSAPQMVDPSDVCDDASESPQMRQQTGDHTGAIRILDKALASGKEELVSVGGECVCVGCLDVALPSRRPPTQMVELLFQRAICYHALGYIASAVKNYEACLSWNKVSDHTFLPNCNRIIMLGSVHDSLVCQLSMLQTGSDVSEETRSFQFLSFYQKEMALYLYNSLDRPVQDMCLDAELQPLFKVGRAASHGCFMPQSL